jgi:hypothetical protein
MCLAGNMYYMRASGQHVGYTPELEASSWMQDLAITLLHHTSIDHHNPIHPVLDPSKLNISSMPEDNTLSSPFIQQTQWQFSISLYECCLCCVCFWEGFCVCLELTMSP